MKRTRSLHRSRRRRGWRAPAVGVGLFAVAVVGGALALRHARHAATPAPPPSLISVDQKIAPPPPVPPPPAPVDIPVEQKIVDPFAE